MRPIEKSSNANACCCQAVTFHCHHNNFFHTASPVHVLSLPLNTYNHHHHHPYFSFWPSQLQSRFDKFGRFLLSAQELMELWGCNFWSQLPTDFIYFPVMRHIAECLPEVCSLLSFFCFCLLFCQMTIKQHGHRVSAWLIHPSVFILLILLCARSSPSYKGRHLQDPLSE